MNKKSLTEKFLENPIAFLAPLYPYLLVLIVLLGLFFISNNNALVMNTIPPKLVDTLSVIPELPVQEPRVTAAVDIATISNPTPAMLEKGKQSFVTICSSCHGTEGKGDGPAGVALNPKPRNFHVAEGWKNGRKVAEMYKTLQAGLGGVMPAYDYLPADERIAIISYVRTFMTDAPMDSPQEIATLDATYKLSEGTKQPGTIPLSGAKNLLLKSKVDKTTILEKAVAEIEVRKNQPGYEQFLMTTSDCRKALGTVLNADASNDVNKFRSVVLSGLSRNGFNATFSTLDTEELNKLFEFIKGLLS